MFEAGSRCVVQAGLNLSILMPKLLVYWDYKCVLYTRKCGLVLDQGGLRWL